MERNKYNNKCGLSTMNKIRKQKQKQSENYYYFALEINVTWVFKFVCICEPIIILQKTRQ